MILCFCSIDDAIQRIVLEAPWFKSSRRVCAYVSCDPLREVDTSMILSGIMSVDTKGLYINTVGGVSSFITILVFLTLRYCSKKTIRRVVKGFTCHALRIGIAI